MSLSSLAAPWIAGCRAAALDRIIEAGVELAVWHRPRPATLDWLEASDWDRIEDLDFEAEVAGLETEVAEGLAEAGYPPGDRGSALGSEIVALGNRLSRAMDCTSVRLRLEVVDTDACRRFHSDLVTARLLTTLVGPATQWMEVQPPERIRQLGRGDVAIFKGRLWVDDPSILHRSPPIEGTGDVRLLLAIDPLNDR